MSNDKNETLYDKTMRQLKNNQLVVAIMVIGAIGLGLSQGVDIFTKLRDALFPSTPALTQVHITIQPYDVVKGYTGSPILRQANIDRGTEVNAVAQIILDNVIADVTPEGGTDLKIKLDIRDNLLISDQAVDAELTVMASEQPTQMEVRSPVADLTSGTDLAGLFSDRTVLDPRCNCIHMILHALKTGFNSRYVDIYQLQDGYSFDPAALIATKDVAFGVEPVSLLIEQPQGQGQDTTLIEALKSSLEYTLREGTRKYEFLELSPYKSVTEFRAFIDPLIPSIAPGPGKGNTLEQYQVDYVVTVNFIVK